MRLVINAYAELEGRELVQEDIDDIREDLEDGIRYYGGKGIIVEAKVE